MGIRAHSSEQVPRKGVGILQLNMTVLSERGIIWLLELHPSYIAVVIQEHRLQGAAFYRAKGKLCKQYHVFGTHARTKNAAPAGGVLILVRRSLSVMMATDSPVATVHKSSNCVVAHIRLRFTTITLVGAYYPPYQEQSIELLQHTAKSGTDRPIPDCCVLTST